MRKYLLFSGCLLLLGAACVAVSLQNVEVPAIEKPDLSNLKPSPVIKTINNNTVVIVQDGNETTICLAGVDRPSAVQSVNSADEADRFVANLLKGENIFVLPDPQQKQTDSNSCIRAYVYRVPDGLFVNEEVIRQGYGLAATRSLFKYMNQFHQLELFARQAGKGIWASNETIPSGKQTGLGGQASAGPIEANEPNKQDAKPLSDVTPASDNSKVSGNDDIIVYVTKSGTKYHSLGCRFLGKSSIPMKLKEAKVKYSPCSVCKPPQ
ncbi:MAG: thermonuclease family protein [Sedimentisphaerales bacterium]